MRVRHYLKRRLRHNYKKKRPIRRSDVIQSVLVGILVFSLLFNLYFLVTGLYRNKVSRVVDGDSFELTDGRRIRLLGIDAPDLENCMGGEAKEILQILIEGKIVGLKNQVKDGYGRILANVFSGVTHINYEMVKRGLAHNTASNVKYSDKLRKAYLKAKNENLGIFSPLCRQITSTNGCLIKGNIRQGRKIYHLPECKNYEEVIIDTSYGDKWFCSEEEAVIEGFSRSVGCPQE